MKIGIVNERALLAPGPETIIWLNASASACGYNSSKHSAANLLFILVSGKYQSLITKK